MVPRGGGAGLRGGRGEGWWGGGLLGLVGDGWGGGWGRAPGAAGSASGVGLGQCRDRGGSSLGPGDVGGAGERGRGGAAAPLLGCLPRRADGTPIRRSLAGRRGRVRLRWSLGWFTGTGWPTAAPAGPVPQPLRLRWVRVVRYLPEPPGSVRLLSEPGGPGGQGVDVAPVVCVPGERAGGEGGLGGIARVVIGLFALAGPAGPGGQVLRRSSRAVRGMHRTHPAARRAGGRGRPAPGPGEVGSGGGGSCGRARWGGGRGGGWAGPPTTPPPPPSSGPLLPAWSPRRPSTPPAG